MTTVVGVFLLQAGGDLGAGGLGVCAWEGAEGRLRAGA